MTRLPIGLISYVTSIYVDHNDVYTTVAGSSITNQYTYWKNNQSFSLPDTLGFYPASYSITGSNGDIYVAGLAHENANLSEGAAYWKNNGYATHLVPIEVTSHLSRGNSIAVSNGDVYIAGFIDLKGVYWKNGVVNQLPLDTTYPYQLHTIAHSIFLSQGNVYVAGALSQNSDFYNNQFSFTQAVYWKNGVARRLTMGSIAKSIFVSGNDVYVAGGVFGADGNTRAAYWKNGVLVSLNSDYSIANAIAVDGSDVYVVGNIGATHGTIWKNRQPQALGLAHANAIFLAHK